MVLKLPLVETNSLFVARLFCRIALIKIVSGNTAFMTAHPNANVYVFSNCNYESIKSGTLAPAEELQRGKHCFVIFI
jgi:hypothetical protein